MAAARPGPLRRALLGLLLLSTLCIGGCWDVTEMNDRAIVISLGVDRAEDGRFLVMIKLLEPVPLTSSRDVPSRTVSAEGVTIEEAVRRIQRDMFPRLYFGHLARFAVSERFARQGMRPLMEWVDLQLDRRFSQLLLVVPGPLKEMAWTIEPGTKYSPGAIRYALSGVLNDRVLLGAWEEDLGLAGRDPVLGSWTPVKGPSNKGSQPVQVHFAGLALFRADRLVDFLNPDQATPFLLLGGEMRRGEWSISIPDRSKFKRAALKWRRARVRRKTEVAGGKVRLRVSFVLHAELEELSGIDPSDEKGMEQVRLAAGQTIAREMKSVFTRLKEAHADPIGLGQLVHANHPDLWLGMRANWRDKGFQQAELMVDPHVVIEQTGPSKRLLKQAQNGVEPFGGDKSVR